MSISVIIRNGEILVKRWNADAQVYDLKPKREQTLSNVLQFRVEIESTTFGQFFELIAKEAALFEKVFEACMYGHPIQMYVDEARKPSISQNPQKGLEAKHLEIGWAAQGFEGELELWPHFGAYGVWSREPYEEGGIAIEFTPINEYKDLEIKLDEKLHIMALDDKTLKLSVARKFTVYDMVHAILNEITWAGDISKGRSEECPFDEKPGEPKQPETVS